MSDLGVGVAPGTEASVLLHKSEVSSILIMLLMMAIRSNVICSSQHSVQLTLA